MPQRRTVAEIAPDQITYAAVREIGEQLNLMKARLGHMHMMKSMRALDEATRIFGYEAADCLVAR